MPLVCATWDPVTIQVFSIALADMIKDLPLETNTWHNREEPGVLLNGTKMPMLNNQKLSYPEG